jgi:hypothetical protein
MSTWLTDPTANKYLQTYFKNFVEISGNFLVHDSSYVDINSNITLKNGAYIKFPDGSILSTANIPVASIPTDISFSNVDISNNLKVKGTTTLTGVLTASGGVITNTITTTGLLVNSGITSSTINNSGQLDTGTIISNNGSFLAGGNPQAIINVGRQGSNVGWNSNNGVGRMDFINTKPSGAPGGFDFYNINLSATITAPIVQISGTGAITCNSITDTGTATLNNVIINGVLTLPNTIDISNINVTQLTAQNATITSTLTSQNATVSSQLTAQNATVNGTLKVIGATYLNTLEWNATDIKILPVTGFLLGRPISLTQFAYSTAAILPLVGDYLANPPNIADGMTNYGPTGAIVTVVNTTNKLITFSPAFGTVLPTAASNKQIYGYPSSTTTIQAYDIKSVITNDTCVPTNTPNNPYVASVNGTNRTITLAGASLTAATGTSTTGVYDTANRLISNAMPSLGTLFGSGASTSQIASLVTSKYAIIVGATNAATAAAATVTGYINSTTQINCAATTGLAVSQFLRDSTSNTDYTKGCTVSAFDGTNNTITVTNGTLLRSLTLPSFTAIGYIPANGTTIRTNNNTNIAINQFVELAGTIPTTNNRIKSYTAGSYSFDLSTNLTGTFKLTTNGYIDQNARLTIQNGDVLTTDYFVEGLNLSTVNINNKVVSLFSANTYTLSYGLSPTLGARVAFSGVALSATQFYYSTAVTPVVGEFLGHQVGSRISAVNTTTKVCTTTNLTVPAALLTVGGYVSTGSVIQLDPITSYTSVAAGQFITGTGLVLSTPYSASVNSSAKTITMTSTTNTVATGTTVSAVIILVGSNRYFTATTSIPTASYISGTNINSISRTIGSISTSVSQTYRSISAQTLQTTPALTAKIIYPISATRIVYNPVAGSIISSGQILNSKTESILGALVSSGGGSLISCELIMVNSTIPSVTPTTVYGRMLKSGSTNYLYYQYAPTVNAFGYSSSISIYDNGGFVSAVAVGGYSRATLTYKDQTLVYDSMILETFPSYISSSGKIYGRFDSTLRTAINSRGLGAIVEIADGINNLKNAWFSTLIGAGAYEVPTLNSANADPAYTATAVKTYKIIASSRAVSTRTVMYVEKVGTPALITQFDFIDLPASAANTNGAYVSTVSTTSDAFGTYYVIVAGQNTWTTAFTAGTLINFAVPTTANIYKTTFLMYPPTVDNVDIYTPVSYTVIPEQTYSIYSAVSDFKYTGSSYSAFAPYTFSFYPSTTFTFSTPQTITYFPTTNYSFYPITATYFVQQRSITIPQSTVNDTFCLLNYSQTLTNKTLTTPTITNPTINTITLQSSTGQTSTQLGYILKSGISTGAINATYTAASPKLVHTTTMPVGVYIINYNIFGPVTTNGMIITAILKYNGVVFTSTASYGIAGYNLSTGATYTLEVTSASQSITLEAWVSGLGVLTVSNPSTPTSYVQYTRIA